MLSALALVLSACQTPEQMAEKEAQRTAKAEAKAAERAAKAEAKMASLEAKLPAGFERIAGDDLTKTMSDTTVTGVSSRDAAWKFTVYRAPDGTLKGTSSNGSDTSDTAGEWWVEADTICTKYTQWRQGKTVCNRVYTNGEYQMVISPDGTITDGKKLKWNIQPGNVAGL